MRKLELITALLTVAAAAFGQADPPSRVARLNFQQGSVSFRPAGVDDWAAATTNYPLTTGDYLWADQGARAELHVGSTAIRLDQTTALSVLNLNDQIVQLSLTAGSLNVHIRYLGENESFEVDTPNIAIVLLRPGDYRISADGDNSVSSLAVRAGDAQVTAGQSGAFHVAPGQSGRFTGVDTVAQEIGGAPPPDDFDGWTRDRDMREDRATNSARYVPREMPGYEDLDGYGRWVNMPPYGMVWQPTAIPAGWAPYHNGHWAWVDPYGWTWIDDAPWGFAPFHYGRWAYAGAGWVWIPGAVAVRPVYSPALVAFVGGGGIGIGVAAWFPLGPGEVYRPAYAVSDVYLRNMNVAYVSNVAVITRVGVTDVYVNQRVVGAVTVVPHDVFVGARPVAVAAVVVRPEMVASVRVTGFAPAIAPERVSVMAGAGVAVRTPPAVFVQRTVVVRNTPPPPPVAFAARQEALRQNPGRPLDMNQMNALRAAQPPRAQLVRPVNQPAGAGFGRAGNGGPQPALRNDRPPSAQTGAHPAVEQPRPADTRPSVEAHKDQPPAKQESKANEKNNKKKNDKTDKKDR
ncbi:MAG: DUF6600 domain-containing protein [Bryobacteraceae bacterium]|jgi:hypothetical protein